MMMHRTAAAAVATVMAGLAPYVWATDLRVTISSNAPSEGVTMTPVWVGFHNGSFDSYDGGTAAAPELERIAEDGNPGPISGVFGTDDGTLIPTGVTQAAAARRQGVVGGLVTPGASVSADFLGLDTGGANQYLSYVSMVVPSNDYFVANGSSTAHDLSGLVNVGDSLSFDISVVNDAGTELNFENLGNGMTDESVAALELLGMGYTGQSVADTGTAENGVVGNVVGDPFTAALLASHPSLNFNSGSLYPSGIATVTIAVIPEPVTGALVALTGGAMALLRRRPRSA